MSRAPSKTPADLARRVSSWRGRDRSEDSSRGSSGGGEGGWRRETFRLPREKARETARDWFERFPKAAYLTEVESWRVLEDDLIEFTMRRLPSAD